MRTYHVVAVILVVLVAVAIKQAISPPIEADTDTGPSTMDVLSMHTTSAYKRMKTERTHDMENVFVEDH